MTLVGYYTLMRPENSHCHDWQEATLHPVTMGWRVQPWLLSIRSPNGPRDAHSLAAPLARSSRCSPRPFEP